MEPSEGASRFSTPAFSPRRKKGISTSTPKAVQTAGRCWKFSPRSPGRMGEETGHIPGSLLARWDRVQAVVHGLERELLARHLTGCETCREELSALGHEPVLETDPGEEPQGKEGTPVRVRTAHCPFRSTAPTPGLVPRGSSGSPSGRRFHASGAPPAVSRRRNRGAALGGSGDRPRVGAGGHGACRNAEAAPGPRESGSHASGGNASGGDRALGIDPHGPDPGTGGPGEIDGHGGSHRVHRSRGPAGTR